MDRRREKSMLSAGICTCDSGLCGVLVVGSACSPLREYETVRAAAPVLKPGWKWNRFQSSEMEVGKGMEADRAWAMAKTALEEIDEHLRTIGPRGGGGVRAVEEE